jgi:hypothetical protein
VPPRSDPDLLVLHGLRLKSFAPADVIAVSAGLAPDEVAVRLEQFREKEWVRYREGALTGWMLLPAGRLEASRLLTDELDATGARDQIDAAYRQFLTLNQALLQVCTDWQLRPVDGVDEPVLNDHTDAAYDANVIGALQSLDAEVQPICAELATVLERFTTYGPRLAHALERTRGGDGDWFTKPTIDSYHTVWFELHENLLATLGIERGTEPSS